MPLNARIERHRSSILDNTATKLDRLLLAKNHLGCGIYKVPCLFWWRRDVIRPNVVVIIKFALGVLMNNIAKGRAMAGIHA